MAEIASKRRIIYVAEGDVVELRVIREGYIKEGYSRTAYDWDHQSRPQRMSVRVVGGDVVKFLTPCVRIYGTVQPEFMGLT